MIRNRAHQMMPFDCQHAENKSTTEPVYWVQSRDFGIAGLVLFLGLASWILPEKRWPNLARRLAARRLRRSPSLETDELGTIQVVVGNRPCSWIEQKFRLAWLAHKYHSWIQLLACYRPRRWQPRPVLAGRQHLEDALAKGRGTVLFTANFAYKDLMTKAAFANAGFNVSHLSRNSHGFAESLVGRRLLNPIYTRIEERFLKERLVFSGNKTGNVNGLIRNRLKENRPLMVTVTPLGRRTAVYPFLDGQIRIATGALNFACAAGAPVLPVFTIKKTDGSFATIVEQPLKMPSGLTRGDMIDVMLRDYVPRLETYVAQYPDQFSFPVSDRYGRALIEPLSPVEDRVDAVVPMRKKRQRINEPA